MIDYYVYLVRMSWPLGLFLSILHIIVFSRLYTKAKYIRQNEWDEWGILVLGSKIAFWVGILFVYIVIFFHSYPDWLGRPTVIEGKVINIDYDLTHERYYLETDDGETIQKVWVDEQTYLNIPLGQEAIVHALPFRKEGYRIEILPPATN